MKQNIISGAIIAILLVAFSAPSLAADRQMLSGHVPTVVSRLSPVESLSGSKQIGLTIGLRLRNLESITNLLRQIYDPASPQYRHYLVPAEFTERFGPTEQDYQTVVSFMQSNGFTISAKHPNRLLLNVSGTVTNIEKAFHTRLRVYQHPTEARTFYAPDVEPSLDLTVPVSRISGLDNFVLPHPADLKPAPSRRSAGITPLGGSAPGGTYGSSDFRRAYAPGVTLTGAGQSVGLVEFDGYFTNDIAIYERANGLSNVTVTNVLLDGFTGTAGGNNGEVALDIELAMAMAPGLDRVIVYEADPQGSLDSILNRMSSDNLASQLSCSWLGGEGDDPMADEIFLEFAAQGQSFFNAAGDQGAYSGSVTFPADNPFITIVGGTLLTTGQDGSWSSESAWNQGGGGISLTYAIPVWQQAINMTGNHGSTTHRNIPDVALVALNVYAVYNNGTGSGYVGTSCSAPLWAGFTALVNQQASIYGQPQVGFLNPALSAIGLGTNYAICFHDITTGNNTNGSSAGDFLAAPGYDLCTGWGTPVGQPLIDALSPPSHLVIFPQAGLVANGLPGGPFNPPVQYFYVSNSGPTSLSWSLGSTTPWLSISPTNGMLPAFGPATAVTVNLTSNANALASGAYMGTVLFTDQGTGVLLLRQFTLQVSPSLVQNGGFETGDFSGWNFNGSIGANSVSSSFIAPHSGQYAAVFGQAGSVAYLSQTLPTLPGQAYLLSFWLANPSGAITNQFLVNWNMNLARANTLLNQTNLSAFNWTNEQFIVVAAGSNSQLQFGFRNDAQYFGLDDVSLVPIPAPLFQTAIRTGASTALSWTTYAGLTYQLQYKTNLKQAVWINLGSSAKASNGVTSASDSFAPDPQRFYRVVGTP